jgi:hypothetical protein
MPPGHSKQVLVCLPSKISPVQRPAAADLQITTNMWLLPLLMVVLSAGSNGSGGGGGDRIASTFPSGCN